MDYAPKTVVNAYSGKLVDRNDCLRQSAVHAVLQYLVGLCQGLLLTRVWGACGTASCVPSSQHFCCWEVCAAQKALFCFQEVCIAQNGLVAPRRFNLNAALPRMLFFCFQEVCIAQKGLVAPRRFALPRMLIFASRRFALPRVLLLPPGGLGFHVYNQQCTQL